MLGDVQEGPLDVAFLDPPYGRGLGEAALVSLATGGWLAPEALCILEEAAGAVVAVPQGFETLERREAGVAQLLFLRAARPQP